MASPINDIHRVRSAPEDPESQTEHAFNLLEDMIVSLDLPPGGSVSEAILSARTGIGRTPIRMALKRLEQMGLVTSLARKGIFIRQMSVEDQLAILEVRRPVEKMLAIKAARHATPAKRDQLRAAVKQMLQAAIAGNLHDYLHFDKECDRIIYETSRNAFATDFAMLLYSHSRRFWVANSQTTDWIKLAQLHWEMMNAVADGQEDHVARTLDELVDYYESLCRSMMGM
jgi:DNA-binding GntR family transcriptional regulator